VVPQVDWVCAAHMPCGSAPLATLLQIPFVLGRLQAWHAVLHALLQQTPWAQNPLKHALPLEQGRPGPMRPQLLITPSMPQIFGLTHWAFVVHDPKHLVALQW
jgi:hypothetical protein